MLCQDAKDGERNRQIKRIIMQNSKSSSVVYLGTVGWGDEGEEEKGRSTGEGTLEPDKWGCVA